MNSLQSNLIAYSEWERGLLAYSSRSTDSHAKNKTNEKNNKTEFKFSSSTFHSPMWQYTKDLISLSFCCFTAVFLLIIWKRKEAIVALQCSVIKIIWNGSTQTFRVAWYLGDAYQFVAWPFSRTFTGFLWFSEQIFKT